MKEPKFSSGDVISSDPDAEGSSSPAERAVEIEAIYATAPVSLCLVDRDMRYVAVNDRFARLLGRDIADIIGRSVKEITPRAGVAAREDLARAMAGKPVPEREVHIAESGETFLVSTQVMRDINGDVSGLSVAIVDISERRRMAEALARTEQRAHFALQSAGQWVWELDIPTNTVKRSPHWKGLLGYRNDEPTADDEERAWRIVHPADRGRADRALKRVLSGEKTLFEATYRVRHKDGRWLWVLSRGSVVDFAPDGSPLRLLATSVDITKQKQVEEELAATVRERKALEQELIRANRRLTTLSEMDSLTELPNRRKFDRVLDHEFRRARRRHPSMALLMIDVDHFKNFNDLYGHQAGDECLRKVAEALRETVKRSGDIVTRYGGEEFAAILSDADEAGALDIAGRMAARVRGLAIAHAGSTHNVVTVSIGLAAFIPDSSRDLSSPRNLLRAADRALYAAKEAGRNRIAVGRSDAEGDVRIQVAGSGAVEPPSGGRPAGVAEGPA